MDSKIVELEEKVDFLQATIDKVRKWIWLKYEDQIPEEFFEKVKQYNTVNNCNISSNVSCTRVIKSKPDSGYKLEIDIKEEPIEEIMSESSDHQIDNIYQDIEISDVIIPEMINLSSNLEDSNPVKVKRNNCIPCLIGDCINSTRTFSSNCNLWRHYAVHLNPTREEYCKEFAEKCPKEILKFLDKAKILNAAKSKCKICGQNILKTSMKRHHLRVHEPQKCDFKCTVCELKFFTKLYLWDHYGVHLNWRKKEYSEEFTAKCPQEILEHIEKTKERYNKRNIKRGKRSKKKIPEKKNLENNGNLIEIGKFTRKSTNQIISKYVERPTGKTIKNGFEVICSICGKIMSKGFLGRHMIRFHDEPQNLQFSCQIISCPFKFTCKSDLWNHYGAHLNPRKKDYYSEEFAANCPREILNHVKKRRERQKVYNLKK